MVIMGKKFIIIDPRVEKEKYNIFTDLKTNGKSIIENTDDENRWWRDVSKQIGRDTSDFMVGDKKMVITSSNYDHRVGIVTINKDVTVKEEKVGAKSRFFIDFLK
jgi:hypothetical protein